VDILRNVGSVLDWEPSQEIENDFRAELRQKTENAFPMIAEALFRFFGQPSCCVFELNA
jgi:hypothetical protein